MAKRIRFHIDTTFCEAERSGVATKYLKSPEAELRVGLINALSCVYAPVGLAALGYSRQDIEREIMLSRNQFESMMQMALNRCEEHSSESLSLPSHSNGDRHNGHEPNLKELPPTYVNAELDPEEYIDVEDDDL